MADGIENLAGVTVITGASAGVGRATAREFARRGWAVALLARGSEGLAAAAADVEECGGRALVIPTDVADHLQVERAADRVIDAFGRIDVWVNNAFAGIFSPFMDITPEEFCRVTDVTYLGQVHGTRAALRHMLARDSGAIILVGSALAYRGIPLQSAYCAAKHALQGFQDSVRSELLHRKSRVRLVMVQLPGVNTPQFDWVRSHLRGSPQPIGAVYEPEVAARAIWLAAHSRRKQLIVGAPAWQAIFADKIASPMLDRFLAATAVDGQQDEQPAAQDRPDNLFAPVPGDHGAHGRFGAIARRKSPLLWASSHRKSAGAAALLLAGGALLSTIKARRKS
jgi:NAD(P)-dependent dehydrogenase (short-subunit alcohol dehydrogenase family)